MRARIIFFFTIVNVFLFKLAYCATYYMPDHFPNLRSAVSGMGGGDTLIIRDGNYSGTENILTQSAVPPSGTSDRYTVIQAENDGGAVFTDGFMDITDTSGPQQYVKYIGLKAKNYTTLSGANHVQFLRCAFTYENNVKTDGNVFAINASSYILVEDCWAWGAGRYKFLASNTAHHVVFRRCVARFDRVNAYSPMAAFHAYGTDYIVFQNCITIDSDHPEFWVAYEERGPMFYSHAGSDYTIVDSCIGLNSDMYFAGGRPDIGFGVKNSVVWDSGSGILSRNDGGLAISGFSVNRFTAGNLIGHIPDPITGDTRNTSGYGVFAYLGNNGTVAVTNSIFYNITGDAALHGWPLAGAPSGNNVLYNNGVNYKDASVFPNDYSTENGNAINPITGSPGNSIPALKYLLRVEDGSNLDGTASDGGDRGATILFRVGVSGTYYGEQGWDSVTNESLWPWPNEARIRDDMSAYSYTGPTINGTIETLSGKRGFCADGQTLTKYIWEYLGNPMPEEIVSIPAEEPAPESIPAEEPAPAASLAMTTLQDFEDGVLWSLGGTQDPTGNGRGWAVLYADSGMTTNGIEIDNIGANGTSKSLKVTINNDEDTNIYFLSPDKLTDLMPEAQGANRMSFYVRFPENFPVQTLPYRYRTWQFGTFIHDPSNWNDTSAIRHYYHFLTLEQVGNGWIKYIITTQPDQERDAGTDVPAEMPYYYDNFGRFYFQFGSAAGGPQPSTPYTIWIDEIKFYHDDGIIGGQIHVGGQDDAGFDGQYFLPPPTDFHISE